MILSKISFLIVLLLSVATYSDTDVLHEEDSNEQINVYVDNLSLQETMTWERFQSINGEQLKKHFEPFWLRWESWNVSMECSNSLKEFVTAFDNWEPWAIKMADATSKFPAGILDGTQMDLGSYDQCINLLVNEDSAGSKTNVKGKFCMVGHTFDFYASLLTKLNGTQTYQEIYGKPPDWIIDTLRYKSHLMRKIESSFWFGTCVPSTCTTQDVHRMFQSVSRQIGANVEVENCETDDDLKEWTLSAKITLYVIGCIGLLCTVGSTVDALSDDSKITTDPTFISEEKYPKESEDTFTAIMRAFSVQRNMKKLMKPSVDSSIQSFNGIRVIGSVLVIFGHVVLGYNAKWRFQQISYYVTCYLSQATFDHLPITAVLSMCWFLLINGFVIVYYNWERIISMKSKQIIFLGLLYKYLRVMPVVAFVMLLHFIAPYFYNGPLWRQTLNQEIELCRENWWRHLLLINNHVYADHACMSHTWYIAVMFQLNIICLAVVVFACRYPRSGLVLGILLSLACNTRDFIVWKGIEMPYPILSVNSYPGAVNDFVDNFHTNIFSNMSPLLIGLLTGYLALKYNKTKIRKIHRIFAWIIFTALMVISLFFPSMFPTNNLNVIALYGACFRTLHSIGFAWYIYACATGIGGCLNAFLSSPFWTVFSRLSFTSYLIHPLIILMQFGAERERRVVLIFKSGVIAGSALLFLSYIAAFFIYIFVEAPVGNIIGIFLRGQLTQKLEKDNTKKSS